MSCRSGVGIEVSPYIDYKEKLDTVHLSGFLWPEERKLMHWLVAEQNEAFAWDDTEQGKFKEEFFPPVEIPTVAHILWVEKMLV